MTMQVRDGGGRDEGVYSIMYAVLVVALVMCAAFVVDLSVLREDRRTERLAADAAATAGAIKLNPLDGAVSPNAACLQAWEYLKVNLPGAGSAVADCPTSKFPTSLASCPSSGSESGPAGQWAVTITWPVADDDPLLTNPGVTGRGTYEQPFNSVTDGTDRCQRIGVSVSRTREPLFAGVGGFGARTTLNSSVARSDLNDDLRQEFPLVVLDQTGCGVILAQGSVSQDSAIRVRNNGLTPGRIAIDSDGSAPGNSGYGCANTNATTAVAGGGGKIQALNGSGGEPARIITRATPAKTTSVPCASGTDPASTPSGTVCPRPFQRSNRVTRAPWDWEYHCSATPVAPTSAACPDAPSRPDYIAQLQNGIGTLTAATAAAAGYTVLSDSAAVCDNNNTYTYYPPGQYFVNCATFKVNKTIVFGGGTVVFRGGVDVKSSGTGPHCLVLNQPVGTVAPPVVGDNYAVCSPTSSTVSPAPVGDMIVYMKGNLTRANADLVAPQTFIYQESDPARGGSRTNRVDLGGGTASSLLLTGPLNGNFKNLTLWSENYAGVDNSESQSNRLGSQNELGIEGILFLPNSLTNFGGDPTYIGTARAQFVTYRLAVQGGGTLQLTPDPYRTLTLRVGGVKLIR